MAIILFGVALGLFAALLFRYRRSNAIFGLAAVAWAGSHVWNQWILSTCSGDCNIRADLVLIAPVVLAASGLALMRLFKRLKP